MMPTYILHFQKTVLIGAVFFMLLLTSSACKGLLEPVPVATSPDEKTVVSMQVREGIPYFKIDRNNQDILRLSPIKLAKDGKAVLENVKWGTIVPSFTRDAWQESPGSSAFIQDVRNEMSVEILESNTDIRLVTIRFRCYNDGVAFRYELDEAANASWVDQSALAIAALSTDSVGMAGQEFTFESPEGWQVQWHKVPKGRLEFELGAQASQQSLLLKDSLAFKNVEEGLWASAWNTLHINPERVNTQQSILLLNLLRR
jgi:hypothetical protein